GPAVMVAIPTMRAGVPLEACLRALDRQTFRDFGVTVIHNGGGRFEGPGGLSFPVEVLYPGGNVGFGAAINLAASASGAPFIAALNDDTEPDAGWLEAL